MTFISRILGFLRDMIVAHIFGATGITDAFYVAFKIPNFMRRLFAEGAFSQAFVPVLAEYKEQHGPEQLRRFVDHVSGTLAMVLLVVTVIGIIVAPIFVMVFAPGFSKDLDRYHLTIEMLRITFPYILFISLTAFASGILNTHNHFAGPAFTPVLLNITMIIAAVWVAPHMAQPIVALAWGVFAAGIVQLLFQFPFLWRLKVMPRFKPKWRDPGVQRVLRLMLPALFGVSVSQIGIVIDTVFASFLMAGSISWLYNSERLMEFPLGMFGAALSTVVLPHLSKCFSRKAHEEYSDTLDWAIRMVILLGVPSALGLIFLAIPLLSTLLHYGQFNDFDVIMTQRALVAYAVGVPFMMLAKILASGFYARQDIKTPVKIAVIALVVNMLLNFAFIFPLKHAGLALASSGSSALNALLLLHLLKKHKIFKPHDDWGTFWIRVGLANAALCLVVWLCNSPEHQWLIWSWWQRMSHLFALLGAAVAVYACVLFACGMRWRHLKVIQR